MAACGGASQSQPATPTAASTTTSSAASVDGFVGQWTMDTSTDGLSGVLEAATAASACGQIEFRVVKDADGTSAAIVFAATCARIRLRGEGKGTVSGNILYWKSEGTVTLDSGRSCRFAFTEGNRATPAGDGAIKVAYNGTVCDTPVSGTETVHRQ
jgi:hypothetical protein